MGVHGLWKLIDPVGKPIPLESLENKVLAVDVSIWLYQLTTGLQTTGGSVVQNAHILGLFNRICKLLYYRIKPIFVFDGGVPALKRETIELRKIRKRKAVDSTERLHEKLLQNLLKQNAVNEVLGQQAASSSDQSKEDDLFALPPIPEETDDTSDLSGGEDDSEMTTAKVESLCDYMYGKDVHSIDITSDQFRSLPPEIRHEILSELIETRKQSSWGRFQEMKKDDNFSEYQMKRLVKRRNVQRSLDDAAKEMGGRAMTLGELEDMFREDGIVTDSLPGQRIAKDNVTKFIYVMGDKCSNEKTSEGSSISKELNPEPTNDQANINITSSKGLDEEEFRNQSFQIDQNFFINDVSSDEDGSPVKEGHTDDYAQQLSREEKLSQEEILRIIKSRQSTVFNEEETSVETELKNSQEIITPGTSLPSTSAMTRKIDIPTNSSSTATESNKPKVDNPRVLLFPSLSGKFGTDSPDFIEDSQEPPSTSLSEVMKNQFISESMNRENDTTSEGKETKSVELFDSSGSEDDFIEINSNLEDTQSEVMEIMIDTNRCVVENDIFADIFQADPVDNEIAKSEASPQPVDKKEEKRALEKLQVNVSPKSDTQVRKMSDVPENTKKITINEENSPGKQHIKSKTQQSSSSGLPQTNEELLNAQRKLYEEELELQSEYYKQERLGSTITQQMILESQELLRLFGLPYVVAPMEAEAQCAFLDRALLTDGTITDDSDIWLFGGRKVYKNFFNNQKFVLQFRDVDIQHFFKLSREQLIQMALLVGSDYTIGIEGIGTVTAIEILAYFSNKAHEPETEMDIANTLTEFKSWIEKNRNNYSSVLSRKMKNVRVTEEFPSIHVIKAYLYPTVDESKERFTWATPDLDRIRQYMKTKFAWKTSRIDDLLLSVMKRLNQRQKQTTLDSFFQIKPYTSIDKTNVSERVMRAINIMKNKEDVDVSTLPAKSPRKKKASKNANTKSTPKKGQGQKPRNSTKKNLLKAFSPSKPGTSVIGQERIPQREKSRLEVAKRRLEAAKVLRSNRKRKRGVLEPKVDCSYLSETSSDSN